MYRGPYLSRRIVLCALLVLWGVALVGCQSKSNPWTGEMYQDPVTYRNPPQSIYAPMPSILPSIDGTAIETDESLEAEMDLLGEADLFDDSTD